jgi:hypothetical protein
MSRGIASRADLNAAAFAGTLWTAIAVTGGSRPHAGQYWHFPGAYDAGWLAELPLPTRASRPPRQPVALLDERDEFDRHCDDSALREAYASRPRTRVYEDISRDAGDAWYSLAARHLGRLAECSLQVVCSVFESRHGDASLGAHWDAWYGAIVQMSGTKVWTIGESLLTATEQPASEITTKAGDILLLPKGLSHSVRTPPGPGHSVHVSFALDRDARPAEGAGGA